MRDYYAILGVPSRADQTAIRSAYHSQARKFHPDVSGNDPAAGDQIRLVNKAYEILGNPRLRQIYDDGRAQARNHGTRRLRPMLVASVLASILTTFATLAYYDRLPLSASTRPMPKQLKQASKAAQDSLGQVQQPGQQVTLSQDDVAQSLAEPSSTEAALPFDSQGLAVPHRAGDQHPESLPNTRQTHAAEQSDQRGSDSPENASTKLAVANPSAQAAPSKQRRIRSQSNRPLRHGSDQAIEPGVRKQPKRSSQRRTGIRQRQAQVRSAVGRGDRARVPRMHDHPAVSRRRGSPRAWPKPEYGPPFERNGDGWLSDQYVWRRVAKAWSPRFRVRTTLMDVPPELASCQAFELRAMRHDVHIHAMRAYFSDGSSQILPHHGLLEDGHTTPAFQLCRYRANLDRLEVTHQSAFNLEGPGWLEVWALQNGG